MNGNVDLGESAEHRRESAPADSVPVPPQQVIPVPGEIAAGPTRAPRTAITRPRWETRYAKAVAASDLTAMVVSLGLREWWDQSAATSMLPHALGLAVLGLTAATLGLSRAWDSAILGQGSEEFSRLLRALVTVAVVVGLVGLALKLPEVRPWVFGVIPLAGVLAAGGRLALRKELHRRRRGGGCTHQVLAVGTEESVAELIVRTRRASYNGWTVTAACTPSGTGTAGGNVILDVPVVGDLDSVAEVVGRGRHRVVSVAQAPGWTSRRLHHLAWDLEGTGAELVVDPGLMEVAGPRLHVAAVDGQPLLRLTEPAFTGVPRLIKAAGDRLASSLLLFLLAPVMVALAIAVRSDGGPIFYRQARIGKDGTRFSVLKFRSTVVGASDDSTPLFTQPHDPRMTRVGALLRKYSLDELPQLLNVLAGSMSLVGPRPPLPEEVASYSRDAQRKLLVKPGLTGLWQISGRSDLSWEESVRLDLRYVENWTLALDALIIWKTVGAVLRGPGAY
ncbi:MAG: sugar transferase [Pseudonocardiaceae bacterium]